MVKKTIALMLLTLCFSTCRKGEDDPLLSFRTRTARIAGEWRLSSGKVLISVNNPKTGSKYSVSFTFSKSRYEGVDNNGFGTGIYMLNLRVEKDGFFTFHEQFDGEALDGGGSWDFLRRSPDVKNKEEVNFIVNSITKGTTNTAPVFVWGFTNMRYRIKELRHKKMVLTVDEQSVIDPRETLSFNGEYTFIQ
jgi:hypothetical protein